MQYYTLVKMKNKMKDFKAKFEEWWELAEEYFTKELEKNSIQHKTNYKILKYKSKAYQKKISKFHLWQSNKYKGIGSR
jgi:hypothetical protein